jgi:hypothetical protein
MAAKGLARRELAALPVTSGTEAEPVGVRLAVLRERVAELMVELEAELGEGEAEAEADMDMDMLLDMEAEALELALALDLEAEEAEAVAEGVAEALLEETGLLSEPPVRGNWAE